MVDSRVQDLLEEVGLEAPPDGEVTIVGHDPVLKYRFPVGEAAAVALAACGVAVSNLWELKGGRPQRVRVDVRRAAASLHSRAFLRVNGGPPPPSPAEGNPLVALYPCRDGRWVHVHDAGAGLPPRPRLRRGSGGPLGWPGARRRAGRGRDVQRHGPHPGRVGRPPPGPGGARPAARGDRQDRRIRAGAPADG